MLNMVDALLELGGDLSRVNMVGNDFVAVAGSPNSHHCSRLLVYAAPVMPVHRAWSQ